MKWQKRARIGIVLFVAGFLVVVLLAVRRPQPAPAADAGPQIVEKDVVSQTTGGLVVHNWGDGYQLTADTERVYADGRLVHTNAQLLLPDRGGRQVTMRADEMETLGKGGDVASARMKGNVRLTTDDGLQLDGGEAHYQGEEKLLTIPGPVSFSRGRMSGTGVGATYDQNRDVVWLLDQARIRVAPDAKGSGGLESTSGAAGLARGDHYALLTRSARIVAAAGPDTPGRELQADEITIRMTPDNERVQLLELRVNSRIVGGTGGSDSMSARDIDLHYGEDGRTLRQARLVDNAVAQLPGGQRVAGRTIHIDMTPDGATLNGLRAVEAVQLDLPAAPGTPSRRITASNLDASGPGGAGVEAATFTGNVEFRETRAAGRGMTAVDRTARANRLDVQTAPGFGEIRQADFRGNVQIVDAPDVTASAPRVVYDVANDRMVLTPGNGDPGHGPEVTDGRANITARTISLTMATRSIEAETQVRSTLQPRTREAGKPSEGAKLPAMLAGDQPVFVTSNQLSYDGSTAQATYTGAARLWQDDARVVQGDVIEVDEKSGNLTARTKVRTVMQTTEVDPKTKVSRRTTTEGLAQLFVYDDAKRMATYTTDAQLIRAQGDMWADRIELFLAAESNDVERVEAYDNVTIREGMRLASGTRLTYTASDERYVLTGKLGAPVVIIEDKPSGCEKSISARVVFYRATDQATMETPTGQACTAEDRRRLAPGAAR